MDYLIDTFEKNGLLHHAYFIEGNRHAVRPLLLMFLVEKVNVATQGNPDFWHEQFTSFTIDDARDLRDRQSNKAFSNNRKIFIVEADTITLEAQNAILKMLEEPTPDTTFFVLMPSRELVLPTVRSRLMIISHTSKNEVSSELKSFLKSSPADRLKIVAPLIEEKDRSATIAFVDGLISILYEKKGVEASRTLKELLNLRSFLNDRSPSHKLILEHIALTIPVI